MKISEGIHKLVKAFERIVPKCSLALTLGCSTLAVSDHSHKDAHDRQEI